MMSSNLLKPLAVFHSQAKPQGHIKEAQSLDDGPEQGISFISTAFDLDIRIKNRHNQPFTVTFEPPSFRSLRKGMPIINGETEEPLPPKQLRHCLISVEHETDFLWLNTKNPEYTSSATPFMENFSDEFSSFPMIFVKRNEAWVRTYTTNFNTSLHDDRYFSASVFSTVEEQVAWNVTGFLLAWRVTLAPHEGSVEYRAGQKNIS